MIFKREEEQQGCGFPLSFPWFSEVSCHATLARKGFLLSIHFKYNCLKYSAMNVFKWCSINGVLLSFYAHSYNYKSIGTQYPLSMCR